MTLQNINTVNNKNQLYLFYQLVIYITMNSWTFILFYGLHSNTVIIYFLAQSILSLAIGMVTLQWECLVATILTK